MEALNPAGRDYSFCFEYTIMTIEIDIKVGRDAASSSVNAEGTQRDVISKEDREGFGLSDSKVLDGLASLRGKRPDHVFLSDHPYFEHYGWEQTHRILAVRSARVLSLDVKPVALTNNTYENMRGSKPTLHIATLAYTASFTTETSWDLGTKISVGQKISYKIGIPSNEVGGETSFGVEASFGVGGSQTRTSTISTSNAVRFEIDPGNSATATLSASQGTLRVEVVYDVSLDGELYYDYTDTFEDHHHWADSTESVMEHMGIENLQTVTQIIEIGFFSDAKVTVSDDQTSDDLQVAPAEMVIAGD